jgi:phosphoenolpyruvate carboxylase
MRILVILSSLCLCYGFLSKTNSFLTTTSQKINRSEDEKTVLSRYSKLLLEGTVSSNKKTYTFEGNDAGDEIYTLPLINDINRLSEILSNIINMESKRVHDLYLIFCNYALARSSGDEKALNQMIEAAKTMTPEDALGVTRAFTQTLNLINAAEVHHRMRYLRALDVDVMSPLPMREDSIAGAIEAILTDKLKINIHEHDVECASDKLLDQKKQAIFDKLLSQTVEIVYTAHPTEVNRRTLLRKYRHISETLATLDRRDLTSYERLQTEESLRRIVASIWGSDEIRREKPTPQQEAKGGIAIIESVLWDAVPTYLRKLNAQCILSLNRSLPIDHAPIKFGSWMGGDRDGNPNVTPKVTHEVAITQRLQAAKLILHDIDKLYSQLAVCKGESKYTSDYI